MQLLASAVCTALALHRLPLVSESFQQGRTGRRWNEEATVAVQQEILGPFGDLLVEVGAMVRF